MADDSDEPIALSAHALAALAEFEAEQDVHLAKFVELQVEADSDALLSMEAFAEDWNESQFWYSDETADAFANQLLDGATSSTTIGVISAPSAFVALSNILRTRQPSDRPRLVLLEHDKRFAVFPQFVFYDFQQPFELPAELKGSLDRIICDPPFLSNDCQTKMALTTRWLLKANSPTRVILCTGERMNPLITKLYKALGVRNTTFEPTHVALRNEFCCYANFSCAIWTWGSEVA